MNFNKKTLQKLPFVALAILAISIPIATKINTKRILGWYFKGPVEKVWYDDKSYPHITIKGKEYNLYYTIWNLNIKIHKGDTIIKQKNDLRIKLIRPNSRDTIFPNGK